MSKNGSESKKKQEKISQTVKNIKSNKGNISGIFNYCDRWCERCNFTNRCFNFQISKEIEGKNKGNMNDLALHLEGIYRGTLQMIEEQLNKLGSNMEDIKKPVEAMPNGIIMESRALSLANEYAQLCHKWFELHQNIITELATKWLKADVTNFKKLNDVLEILSWYQYFIPAKIERAYTLFDGQDELNEYDNNGLAKVALIAIDKCVDAFSYLLDIFSSFEDELLKILTVLSELRKLIELEKPNARSFTRPGFDE